MNQPQVTYWGGAPLRSKSHAFGLPRLPWREVHEGRHVPRPKGLAGHHLILVVLHQVLRVTWTPSKSKLTFSIPFPQKGGVDWQKEGLKTFEKDEERFWLPKWSAHK